MPNEVTDAAARSAKASKTLDTMRGSVSVCLSHRNGLFNLFE